MHEAFPGESSGGVYPHKRRNPVMSVLEIPRKFGEYMHKDSGGDKPRHYRNSSSRWTENSYIFPGKSEQKSLPNFYYSLRGI
jgi:hypothetical protein